MGMGIGVIEDDLYLKTFKNVLMVIILIGIFQEIHVTIFVENIHGNLRFMPKFEKKKTRISRDINEK